LSRLWWGFGLAAVGGVAYLAYANRSSDVVAPARKSPSTTKVLEETPVIAMTASTRTAGPVPGCPAGAQLVMVNGKFRCVSI
jgi:hypothetical protein